MARKPKKSIAPALVEVADLAEVGTAIAQAIGLAPAEEISLEELGAIMEPPVATEAVVEPTDAEISSAITSIEAIEAQEPEATELPAEAPVVEEPTEIASFDDLTAAVTEDAIELMLDDTTLEIELRGRFEDEKNPTNDNIHRTLKAVRKSLVLTHAAKAMLASNVEPSFMNRQLSDGSRYNVYAIGKFADFVDGLTGRGMRNAINIACMRSLFNFHKAGVAFTGEHAKAAASDKIRADAAVRKHLISHTVSASTAPTQASSTMQALQTLGVVRVLGSRRSPTYEVVDGPVTRKLQAIAEAMAA